MLWFLLACVLGVSTEEEQTTISLEHTKAVHYVNTNNALKSAVRLAAYDESGNEIAHGSGNYFKIGGDHFIVTAAHNIAPSTSLEAEDGYRSLKLYPVIVDVTRDIAILIPEEKLRMAKPVDYRVDIGKDMTGDTVVYAGYPADLGKSTFTGTIANDQRYMMVIQSFALPGSSGSVVFNTKGRPVGVINALRLGMYEFSPFPQMHATLVYCQKLRDYDRYTVRGVYRTMEEIKVGTLIKDTGKFGVIIKIIQSGRLNIENPIIKWRLNYEIYYSDGSFSIIGGDTLQRMIQKGDIELL